MLFGGITALSLLAALLTCWGTGAFGSWQWLWVLPVGFCGSWLALALLAFLFLWVACLLVRPDKPQEQDSPFYRRLTNLYIALALKILRTRIDTQGLEQLPGEGRYLLVCNHLSLMDPLVLLHVFPKSQLAFISKQENDSMFIIGKLMHKILCQPINRENDREALKTILKCIQIIREDKASIGVFPEGYTSRDGLLHPFRNGVFKIAQKAQVPIVVCTLQNTQSIFRNALRLKRTRVELHLVGVVSPEQFQGHTAVAIGEEIHEMMASDLGPDKVEKP